MEFYRPCYLLSLVRMFSLLPLVFALQHSLLLAFARAAANHRVGLSFRHLGHANLRRHVSQFYARPLDQPDRKVENKLRK